MQKFLLDTSALIDFLKKQEWIGNFTKEHIFDHLITSTICEIELLEGVFYMKNQKDERKKVRDVLDSLQEIITFDSNQAEIAAEIRSQLKKKGQKIEDFDTLIAAAAIASGSILVTKNTKHFSRITKLQLYSLSQ